MERGLKWKHLEDQVELWNTKSGRFCPMGLDQIKHPMSYICIVIFHDALSAFPPSLITWTLLAPFHRQENFTLDEEFTLLESRKNTDKRKHQQIHILHFTFPQRCVLFGQEERRGHLHHLFLFFFLPPSNCHNLNTYMTQL